MKYILQQIILRHLQDDENWFCRGGTNTPNPSITTRTEWLRWGLQVSV